VYIKSRIDDTLIFSDDFDDGDLNGWSQEAEGQWLVKGQKLHQTSVKLGHIRYRLTVDKLKLRNNFAVEVDAKLVPLDYRARLSRTGGIVFGSDKNGHYELCNFSVDYKALCFITFFENLGRAYHNYIEQYVLEENVWYKLRVEVDHDNYVTFYLNGERMYTRKAHGLQEGYVGVFVDAGYLVYDNFRVVKLQNINIDDIVSVKAE
jgi:hypothetical protein